MTFSEVGTQLSTDGALLDLRVGIVGPLPPPAGGMATQTQQLIRLLQQEGVKVSFAQTNCPYSPAWVGQIKGLRALFRLVPYLWSVWCLAGKVDVIHLMANSGWSWQLFSAPVIWLAKLRKTPVIVNYRGGEADSYFQRSFPRVKPSLLQASRIVVPSGFLQTVFSDYHTPTTIVPNIIDLERFSPKKASETTGEISNHIGSKDSFKVVITRNLEPIYGIDTAIKAVAKAQQKIPNIHLAIAGSGPEKETLQQLAQQLGVADVVSFVGRLDREQIVDFYQSADLMLNPTTVDNMPNSVLEALACGVPVLSTDVGGIPFIVTHEKTAILVPPSNPEVMSNELVRLYEQPRLRLELAKQGIDSVKPYAWPEVKQQWLALYRQFSRVSMNKKKVSQSAPMRLYTKLVSSLIFPLHERLKKHTTVAVRQQMEQTEWFSPEEITQLQVTRLRDFLVDIGEKVPYYRNLFQSLDFDPQLVNSLDDLHRLPLMGKPEIRANTEQMKAVDAAGLARFNTGGSSGEPLIFFIGNKRVSHDVAAKWRATRWWGVDIGDPEIVVWGSPIELGSQDRVRQVRDKLIRTQLLPAFEMSEEKLDSFIDTIQQVKPPMLFGYPSALAHIASHAEKRGVTLSDLGIRVAFVTSERLYDYQRDKIEQVFGCPVANGYGGRDAGFIAHQCPEGSFHITAEDIIVEIVDAEGNVLPRGQSGEIVVTHLATRDFPFVRYRTGDIGILGDEPCACGRGLPVLKEIQGRSTDFLIAQDGTVLHGLALIYILRDLPGIASFKITQESLDLTVVDIVKGPEYSDDNEQAIKEVFHQRLGQDVEITIHYCDEIEPEKSGKFRYVISKVSNA